MSGSNMMEPLIHDAWLNVEVLLLAWMAARRALNVCRAYRVSCFSRFSSLSSLLGRGAGGGD